jgi:hypothetical protein
VKRTHSRSLVNRLASRVPAVCVVLGLVVWGLGPEPARAQAPADGAAPLAVATPVPTQKAPPPPTLPQPGPRPATAAVSGNLSVSGTDTFVVDTTVDTPCSEDGSGGTSLRCAIIMANHSPATVKKVIDFDISPLAAGSDACPTQTINGNSVAVCTISPATDLPPVNAPMTTINGYSQTGAAVNTSATADNAIITIEINGSGVSSPHQALLLNSTGDLVEGLSIANYSGNGIVSYGAGNQITGNFLGIKPVGTGANVTGADVWLTSGGSQIVGGATPATRNVIGGATWGLLLVGGSSEKVEGNLIGTNQAGTAASTPALTYGVIIQSGTSNVIDGTTAAARNVISGTDRAVYLYEAGTSGTGTNGNVVEGNYLGTDVTGTAAIPNNFGVMDSGTGPNTIGGTVAGAGNLISASYSDGVFLGAANQACTGVKVQGNEIGTNAAGTAALGNPVGIYLNGCKSVTIGGATALAGNVISGSSSAGIQIDTGASFPTASPVIEGNLIGTDAAGSAAIANSTGIQITGVPGSTIGGSVAGAGNLISGNAGIGLYLTGGATGTHVYGNKIGTNLAGTGSIANNIAMYIDHSPGTIIGGGTAGLGNLVSGNVSTGVYLADSPATVQGNEIGTNLAGTASVSNGTGIFMVGNTGATTLIGGLSAGQGNLISGNHNNIPYGIFLNDSAQVLIEGNTVGLSSGGGALGNSAGGIYVDDFSHNVSIGGTAAGAANTIASNGGAGIKIGSDGSDTGTVGIQIRRNSTFGNIGPGIQLAGDSSPSACATGPSIGADPNDNIPCPVVSSASTLLIKGTGLPGATIEVFVAVPDSGDSNQGEGKTYVGTTAVPAGGVWSLTAPSGTLTSGQLVTADQTKTLVSGGSLETSEFAANVTVS